MVMKDKAVVISIDAMTGKDLRELGKRKNISSLLSNSSLVERMHTVFPSYTYPCHASIITGCNPGKTGIFHNEVFSLEEVKEWYWWDTSNKRKTIIDVANENGLSTASIAWPTLSGKKAKYTIPEIWPLSTTKDPLEMYRKAVSDDAWPVFEEAKKYLTMKEKPFYDLYATCASKRIISSYSPDITLIHLSQIDHVKHLSGSSINVLQEAYDFIDERVGEIVGAVKESGAYDRTTFFLLGDHGHLNVDSVFSINTVLKEKGYITVKDGRIESYRIICHPSSFTSVVYLNGIGEKEAEKVFENIKKEYPGKIDRIMTRYDADEIYHLSGPFSLVLDSTDNTIFSFSPFLPVTMDREEADKRNINFSTHGYSPEKGPQPPFVVSGSRANKGKIIPWGRLVDEGPTILSLFGLDMDEDIDGRVMDGLINYHPGVDKGPSHP